MNRGTIFITVILALAVIASGISVVYSKYLSRKIFAQLQSVNMACDRAKTRWMRLQLEESALASYPRVENNARNKLGLHIPLISEIHVLR